MKTQKIKDSYNSHILKIVKTAARFVILTVTGSLLFALFFTSDLNFKDEVSKYFLYFIGYGDAEEINATLLHILAIIGTVSIGLFSAKLTVDIFWRNNMVRMSPCIGMWSAMGDNYLSFIISNKGSPLGHIGISFLLYDEKGNILSSIENVWTFPLIEKGKEKRIDISLGSTFFREFVYNTKYLGATQILCTIVRYVDISTNMESTK